VLKFKNKFGSLRDSGTKDHSTGVRAINGFVTATGDHNQHKRSVFAFVQLFHGPLVTVFANCQNAKEWGEAGF
jgi:hypothetical protein